MDVAAAASLSMDASDVELAAMLGLGNVVAFDLLFLRYAASVRRIGLALLGNEHAADDLVQETFLRLWRHRARYAPARGPLGSWLFAIARNEALSQVRNEGRHSQRIAAAGELARLAEHSPDALTEAIGRDEGARVRAAVDHLPSDQRMA